MADGNHTVLTEFILLGFTDNPKLQVLLFMVFLLIYLLTLVGNLGMIVLIRIDSKLHTPMYFFISSLSFLDVSYSTTFIPSTLMTFVAETEVISYTACRAQLFLFCIAVTGECYHLAVMAYDRFIAICNPLLYPVIMSKRFCVLLVCSSYFISCMNATIQTLFIFHLSFCNSNIINHFFCDVPPMLKLSCSDTSLIWSISPVLLCSSSQPCSLLSSLTSALGLPSTRLNLPKADAKPSSPLLPT